MNVTKPMIIQPVHSLLEAIGIKPANKEKCGSCLLKQYVENGDHLYRQGKYPYSIVSFRSALRELRDDEIRCCRFEGSLFYINYIRSRLRQLHMDHLLQNLEKSDDRRERNLVLEIGKIYEGVANIENEAIANASANFQELIKRNIFLKNVERYRNGYDRSESMVNEKFREYVGAFPEIDWGITNPLTL